MDKKKAFLFLRERLCNLIAPLPDSFFGTNDNNDNNYVVLNHNNFKIKKAS